MRARCWNRRIRNAGAAFGVALICFAPPLLQAGEIPWSFRPIAHPKVPPVKATAWLKDGVDVFILARLEAREIAPGPDADRATLLRRASFDLTGLPPAPEELDAFLRDPAPDDQAFARVLDRLLASPRFGERWGRHWLDSARYADSVGRTMNAVFPYAFRYRNYVIDAFNRDKPFNRFAAEQIAGDLLPARTAAEKSENLIATGFLALAALDLTDRGEQFVMDRVDDPISQRDYYALAGIFYSTQTWTGQAGTDRLGPNGYVDEDRLLRLPGAPTAGPLTGGAESKASSDAGTMQLTRGYPTVFAFRPERAMGVSEGEAKDCELRVKGEPSDRGEAPPRGQLAVQGLPPLPPIPKGASGRLQLAQWLTLPENPLTARVMANRIWQHLFGAGLAPTVDDFGVNGEPPTHPELLDHLAVRFVEGGWSVKKLLLAVMLSHTYRLASTGGGDGERIDPANALHWRMSPRRLELEPLRDTLLLLSGRLRVDRPEGIQVAGFGGKGRETWTRSLLPDDAPYRTVYLPVLRSKLPAMHELFDFPEPSQIKGRRDVTTAASQALFFLNSRFVGDVAQAFAERLLAEKAANDGERIERTYRRILSRGPTREEADDARGFLESSSLPPAERWAALAQALIASAEFRYVF